MAAMKRPWQQTMVQDMSRWQYRKYMRALRRTSEQSHAVNWDAVSDPDGGLDLSQLGCAPFSNKKSLLGIMVPSSIFPVKDG